MFFVQHNNSGFQQQQHSEAYTDVTQALYREQRGSKLMLTASSSATCATVESSRTPLSALTHHDTMLNCTTCKYNDESQSTLS
jgi:hypothetical protein